MKKAYIIPHHNMKGGNNKETIERSIRFLSNQYMIDWSVMENINRIELLETIVNLTHIYLNMSLEE